MPYEYKRKASCRQASGEKGTYVTKKVGASSQKCWKSERAFKNSQRARHANEADCVECDEELIESFVRQQVRRQLNELFELGDLQGYVNDLGNLGKIVWNDIKFALSGLKILKSIFTIRDSKAAAILQDWENDTRDLVNKNESLADALNKSQASLDLFVVAPALAVGKMLASKTLQNVNGKIAFTDSLKGTIVGQRRGGDPDKERERDLTARLRKLFFITEAKNGNKPLIVEKIGGLSRNEVRNFITTNVPGYADWRKLYTEKIIGVNEGIQNVLNKTIAGIRDIYAAENIDDVIRILSELDPELKSGVERAYEQTWERITVSPDIKNEAGEEYDESSARSMTDEMFRNSLLANMGESVEQLKDEIEDLRIKLANKGLTQDVLESSDIPQAKELAETFVKISEAFSEIENLAP